MSVTGTTTRNDLTGTPGTREYSFTFKATQAAWVKVALSDVPQSAGYSVRLNANQDTSPGGSVTFSAAPGAVPIAIYREIPLTQDLSLSAYSPFPAKTLEYALDRLTMMAQQLARLVTDSVEAAGRGNYNVTTFGARCDGVTDDGPALAGMITELGATECMVTFPGPCLVNRNLTFPANLWCEFGPNAFDFTGTGTVTFQGMTARRDDHSGDRLTLRSVRGAGLAIQNLSTGAEVQLSAGGPDTFLTLSDGAGSFGVNISPDGNGSLLLGGEGQQAGLQSSPGNGTVIPKLGVNSGGTFDIRTQYINALTWVPVTVAAQTVPAHGYVEGVADGDGHEWPGAACMVGITPGLPAGLIVQARCTGSASSTSIVVTVYNPTAAGIVIPAPWYAQVLTMSRSVIPGNEPA